MGWPNRRGRTDRRTVLQAIGGALGASLIGAGTYAADQSFVDEDGDGIPDRLERSAEFHDRLETIFGADQFEGLDPDRKDLLLDVRYVEGTTVSEATKEWLVDLFRENGIHAQWLDYPEPYDRATFDAEYGSNTRRVLWGRDSFYYREVEEWLQDVALQVVIVPGRTERPYRGLVYSPWKDANGGGVDGHVNGFNVGNRAIAAQREETAEERRLLLHEIAHLGLCHDRVPENTGVMGTSEELDLMDHEWVRLRNRLDNVRDTTDYDVVTRRCLWAEQAPW